MLDALAVLNSGDEGPLRERLHQTSRNHISDPVIYCRRVHIAGVTITNIISYIIPLLCATIDAIIPSSMRSCVTTPPHDLITFPDIL